MHFLDTEAFVREYPEYEEECRRAIEHHSKEADAYLTAGAIYCAHSMQIRDHFCQPLYETLGRIMFGGQAELNPTEMEDANARLGVNVESETQAGLVKVVSALHVCKKCLSSGASENESRNVTSRMRFTRSWDEPGIEILTCQRCGHIWKR